MPRRLGLFADATTEIMMELSIIIPTYNRSGLLRKTLQGLCEQVAGDYIHEVLVINDGSKDDTPEIVNSFSDRLRVRCISQPQSGVSTARNRGLLESRGNLLLLLDDDVIPNPNLVMEHLEFHRRFPQSESVLLGYVTWLSNLPVTPFMRWYGEYGALFGYALLKDGAQTDRRYLYTCNISFKMEFLRANVGFDQNLTVYEDHELGYRLAKQGMKMYFSRKAIGYHNQHFTFQQACERMQRYRHGLNAFLLTDAGREMQANQPRWKSHIKSIAGHRYIPVPGPISRLMDSDFRLPHILYRIFYWYYAILPYAPTPIGRKFGKGSGPLDTEGDIRNIS